MGSCSRITQGMANGLGRQLAEDGGARASVTVWVATLEWHLERRSGLVRTLGERLLCQLEDACPPVAGRDEWGQRD